MNTELNTELNSESNSELKSDKIRIQVDSQWINSVQNCARKMNFEFIQNLVPTHVAEPLEKGKLLHSLFAHYYTNRMKGIPHSQSIVEIQDMGKELGMRTDLDPEVIKEVIFQTLQNLSHHQYDGWQPIAVEEPFSKVWYEDDSIQIIHAGKIDLIVDIPQLGIHLVDHKSGARSIEPLMTSNQFAGYCLSFDVPRFLVNKIGFQKTLSPEKRFPRYFMNYTKEWLTEFKANTIYWVKQIIEYRTKDYFPPNFTSCDKYGGCIFYKLCQTEEQHRDWKSTVWFNKREKDWDPYTVD